MRYLAIVLCVAAIAAPVAFAKGRISITLGDSTPRVGQQFTVHVRTGWVVRANDWLRLIAVAPGKDWYQVVGTVTATRRGHTRTSRTTALRSSSSASARGTGALSSGCRALAAGAS
jgi:hypothetical protein